MRILVIGYGNPSRRDDGVALVVVNSLRRRLGLPALDEQADGYEDLGQPLDTLFLQQLTPELAETLAGYERVVFVDAHTGTAGADLIRRASIDPNADPALVSHHFKPGRLLALAQALYGAAPQAELVSILGFDFDFGPELSPTTATAAGEVVEALWRAYGTAPA
jgi:hydrogenase maturation protease